MMPIHCWMPERFSLKLGSYLRTIFGDLLIGGRKEVGEGVGLTGLGWGTLSLEQIGKNEGYSRGQS